MVMEQAFRDVQDLGLVVSMPAKRFDHVLEVLVRTASL